MKSIVPHLLLVTLLAACGGETRQPIPTPAAQSHSEAAAIDPLANKGIGPIKEVALSELDEKMATEGQQIFAEKCTACHKVDSRYIGPALKGVTERRSPEWIMNMILNPQGMLESDPIAKQLLAEANGAPMANQNLSQEEARKILEYFRTLH